MEKVVTSPFILFFVVFEQIYVGTFLSSIFDIDNLAWQKFAIYHLKGVDPDECQAWWSTLGCGHCLTVYILECVWHDCEASPFGEWNYTDPEGVGRL